MVTRFRLVGVGALTVLVVALAASGGFGTTSGSQSQQPRLIAWGKPTRGTVVLVHGLFGSPSDMAVAPFSELVRGLVREGWRVESVPLPEDGHPRDYLEAWLRDRPASYLARWLAEVRALIPRGPVVFGGVSWGGWHAIEAAAHFRHVAWFAISPVTQVAYVAELHGTPSTLNITSLSDGPGFVDWGTADNRVGWRHTKALTAAATNVAGVQFDGMGHTTTPAVVADVLRWMRRWPKHHDASRL